jgi:hypothetical protein
MIEQNGIEKVQKNNSGKQKKPTSALKKLRRKFAKTRLRTALVWYCHRGLEPADVYFAAYPKSGSTWSRFVLFEILTGMSAGFRKTNTQMGGVGLHRQALRLLPGGGRLLATHEDYQKQYGKAIYIVRDPRDIVLAEYAFLTALDLYHVSLDEFIKIAISSVMVHGWGPWQHHISSWLDSPIAGTENMLLLRFEDLRKDPVEGFARMVDFLGVDVKLDKVRAAVENNTIQRMREKEDKEPVRSSIRGRFVREGAVRGWLSKLTPAQALFIEKHAGDAMARLGYPRFSELNAEAAVRSEAPNPLLDTLLRA